MLNKMRFLNKKAFCTFALLGLAAQWAMAAPAVDTDWLKQRSLCEGLVSEQLAIDADTRLYDALRKQSKEMPTGVLNIAAFPLPQPFDLDGMTVTHAVFVNGGAGMLLPGRYAAELAQRYQLGKDTSGWSVEPKFSREVKRVPGIITGWENYAVIYAEELPGGKYTALFCQSDAQQV